MADTYNPYSDTTPTAAEIFARNNAQYLSRAEGSNAAANYRSLGKSAAIAQGTFGIPATKVGLSNLLQMLQTQGRVDPRLLAQAQAMNARRTQTGMDAARGAAARGGFGGGSLYDALQASIGQAGRNTAANLDYQDLADSYKRNQENLGLLNQLVINPQLGYASLGIDATKTANQLKAAKIGFWSSLVGGAGRALGG